jgi:molybdopterin-containing oxidoreductase family membrane subunit
MTGIGIWGNNVPVGWAFDIINFVWWIGIGHAGTAESPAILLLFRQHGGRRSTGSLKAMTPSSRSSARRCSRCLHTGRPWLAVVLACSRIPNLDDACAAVPQPAHLGRSSRTRRLRHRVAAFLGSPGLVPDLATLRGPCGVAGRRGGFSGSFALAARLGAVTGTANEMAYLLLAGISTPLVLSVHSVVSFDFAVSVLPGWHATILPAVLRRRRHLLRLRDGDDARSPLRKFYNLEDFITMRHIHNMTKGHAGDRDDRGLRIRERSVLRLVQRESLRGYMMLNRMTGPYAPFYWSLIAINAAMIQLFWFRRVRDNVALLFVLSLLVNVRMWLERFIIIVTSLPPRLPPVVVGHVRPDAVGLRDVHGNDRTLPVAVLPVHPLPAGARDVRDAHDRAEAKLQAEHH